MALAVANNVALAVANNVALAVAKNVAQAVAKNVALAVAKNLALAVTENVAQAVAKNLALAVTENDAQAVAKNLALAVANLPRRARAPQRSTILERSALACLDRARDLIIMIAVKKPAATYEDLVALPENMVGEIIDGELYAQPRPAVVHANAGSNLGGLLSGPFRFGNGGPGGWIILWEPELHFGRDVLVPDLAAWRRERMPEPPGTPAITLAPDWVCEVLSPSTAKLDRTKKLGIYAREQVRYAWFVDPLARTLEAFRLEGGRWSLLAAYGEESSPKVEPFEAVALVLADVFRW